MTPENAPAADACSHPAPACAVMANEFSHYQGAVGPEGLRRTVTHFGPVIGGMPIKAWHCETCGLLKLEHPDGRREERQLFPGPQPGLLSNPTDIDVPVVELGRQARVSGMSVSHDLEPELAGLHAVEKTPGWMSRGASHLVRSFGALDGWTQAAVVFFLATLCGLAAIGVLAAAAYSTPDPAVKILAWATVACFATGLVALLAPAVFPFPRLQPAPAENSLFDHQPWSIGLKVSVFSLVVAAVLGFTGAVLAVDDYSTSPVEGWLVLATVFAFSLGVTVALSSALNHSVARASQDLRAGAVSCVSLGFICVWAAAICDYVGLQTKIWFTTLDVWLAGAGAVLLLGAAVAYMVASVKAAPLADQGRA